MKRCEVHFQPIKCSVCIFKSFEVIDDKAKTNWVNFIQFKLTLKFNLQNHANTSMDFYKIISKEAL